MTESDFDSPGFEHLRLFQSMEMLYYKLVALNYRKEFCVRYKCPYIHKYYFSVPHKRQGEQQFLFTCLCAWLIKDKCLMNLDLDPQEYEDPDSTIGIIVEALKLLVCSDDSSKAGSIGFPPGRLKNGYGPEAIWTMNIFADRALEVQTESEPNIGKVDIVFYNKSHQEGGKAQISNSITIGQPIVGGGLTTRPLGSYQVDDASLMFDSTIGLNPSDEDTLEVKDEVDENEWYSQVERARSYLESANLKDESATKAQFEDWGRYLNLMKESCQDIHGFITNTRPLLEAVSNRIDRQLQLIGGRENFIQSNIGFKLADFSKAYRDFLKLEARRKELTEQVDTKADQFEDCNRNIKDVEEQIQSRVKELNDVTKLRELSKSTCVLLEESGQMDVKIGLLLTVYAKIHKEAVQRQSH